MLLSQLEAETDYQFVKIWSDLGFMENNFSQKKYNCENERIIL
jgi:hypothetical protein